MPQAEDDLDSHLIQAADRKSLVDHIFFQADARSTHEQGQALARIALVWLVAILLLVFATLNPERPNIHFNLALCTGYGVFSLFYHRWISHRPRTQLWRRYIVILTDLGLVGYINFNFGVAGLGFYPLYLWIIIGNGLRFGPHYLGVALAVGASAFIIANLLSGAAGTHTGLIGGLFAGLLLMPRFFLAMIRRLAEANRMLASQKIEAEHQATHDPLTGLPNRALLEARLGQALARAKRTHSALAVIFIDLDAFKSINDHFGHETGDRLLQQVADCLRQNLRDGDTVARLGGDEFIVLAENCDGESAVAAIVDQISNCSGRYYRIGQHESYVTWSCGVAVYPHDGEDSGVLIRNADTAMYRAKEAGPNQFRLYDAQMSSHVAQQLELRDALRRGIEQRQFEVHYQPQVSLPGGEISDLEALVRWRHPQRGLLYPGEFIDYAEQSGLITAIGQQVLEQVLEDAADWRDRGIGEFNVHVNVSPQQLAQAEFPGLIDTLCDRHHWDRRRLGLEITESMLIGDLHRIGETLRQLRDSGLIISLDDFGTGFSSLDYLKRLSIDRLKIDRSFVRDIPDDRYDCTLIQAVLMIGAQLGVDLVAEGVETRRQYDWLLAQGCRQMQGFLFAPGLAADDLVELIRKNGGTFRF